MATICRKRRLQHGLGHRLAGLANAQVGQHLFGASENRVELVGAVELLHQGTHSALRERTATEDVAGVVGNLVCATGRVRLEETCAWSVNAYRTMMRVLHTDGTAQLLRLLLV